MGIKLLILLGLLAGVLYCLHILAQDYQAITAPKLLRHLFKRNVNSTINYKTPKVRWRMVLKYDPIQCARFLYCILGTEILDDEVKQGLVYMLKLKALDEDEIAHEEFKKAYYYGAMASKASTCSKKYTMCPFKGKVLLDLLKYLLYQKSCCA